MRNRQVGPDDAADTLAQVVASVTYKPGWTLNLQEISRGQGSEGLTLTIAANVPNTVGPGNVDFLHLFPVPPAAYDTETWARWVLDCILSVEQHEALEWYRLNGHAPFFPEHRPGRNPYTIAMVKTQADVDAPATPWTGGRPTDPHFQEATR